MHLSLFCVSSLLLLLTICCFCVGEWICKACANGLGLKTGIEGHEWKLEEEVDDKIKERRPPSSVEKEDDDEDEDEVNFVATTLVDSDDEEMPVRGKKRRRKVLEVDSSDDE